MRVVRPIVVVIGGGVAGLTVAYEIHERARGAHTELEVVCLEASGRPGGNIRTDRDDGFVCEWGPNGFLDNAPPTLDLVRRLKIEDRLLASNAAAAIRYLFRGGRLRKLPAKPVSFLGSDVLSWGGKLRVLLEPFRRRRDTDEDESIFDFAERRIGVEAARVLADAMVSGIYAGDARRLSLRATFPKMQAMEREHGSLFRAMTARRKETRARGGRRGGPSGPGDTLTSFREGLQELTDALAGALGSALRLRTRVTGVADLGLRGYRVYLHEGAPIDATAVVLACPAWSAAEIVAHMDSEMSQAMDAIPSVPVAVVHLGFESNEVAHPLAGFGYLVPRGEGPRILGTLWASSIFPGRTPAGKILLTSMVGGAHDGDAIRLPDDELTSIVRTDLRTTMGIEAAPRFTRVYRHPKGIPQYTLGHLDRLAVIERRLEAHSGLLVCGNSYRGISVNACVEEAPRVAEAVLRHVAHGNARSSSSGT
jgi:oxygen-dependent protoporphyrinogen oxidase